MGYQLDVRHRFFSQNMIYKVAICCKECLGGTRGVLKFTRMCFLFLDLKTIRSHIPYIPSSPFRHIPHGAPHLEVALSDDVAAVRGPSGTDEDGVVDAALPVRLGHGPSLPGGMQ